LNDDDDDDNNNNNKPNNNNNNNNNSGSHNVKMQKVYHGKCITPTTYNNHWIAVTIYTLETWFVSGI
jgi:hypothetical protein